MVAHHRPRKTDLGDTPQAGGNRISRGGADRDRTDYLLNAIQGPPAKLAHPRQAWRPRSSTGDTTWSAGKET